MDKHAAQEERMEDLRRHFSQVSTTLADKFRSFMEHEHEHLTDICRAIDQRVTQKVNSFDGQLGIIRNTEEQHNQHHVMVCADMDRHFTHVCNEMDVKFAAQNASQDRRVEDMGKHFINIHTSMDQTFRDKNAMQDELLENHRQHVTATIQQLDQKCAAQGQDLAADILDTRQMLSDNTAHLIAEVTALRSGNASRLDELSHTVEANSRHCVDMYSKLDQTTVEYHQHFTNVCAAIDAKHGEKLAAMEVREQNRHQQVTEVHQSAVKLFEDKNLALSTETQAQTKRISELQRLLEKQRQDSRGMCDSIEKKLNAADSAQDSRLDDMRDAIEANHRHFTEVAKTLNSKFSEENAACTRRITDEINSISKRCSDNKLVHQQDAAKHHQIVMGVCEVLRRDIDVSSHDLQGKFAELSQRIAGSESEVKSMCSSLDTTWRQQLATQQAETKKLSALS